MAKKVFVGADQSPLRQGLLRAAVIAKKNSGSVSYYIHDADTIGFSNTSTGNNLVVQTFSSNEAGWVSVEFNYPFKPIPFSSASVREWVGCGKSRAKTLAEQFRVQYPGYRRGLVYGGSAHYVAADLDYLRWTNLRKLVLEELLSEINWAAAFTQGSIPAARASFTKLAALYSVFGSRDVAGTMKLLGKILLGNRLSPVNITTSRQLWQLDSESKLRDMFLDDPFSVLDRFLSDAYALNNYNDALAASERRAHNANELPFWIIQKEKGHWSRNTLMKNGALSVNSLQQRYGKGVSIIPKAVLLLLQMGRMGCPYMTELAYQADTENVSRVLNIPVNPSYKVGFDFRGALRNDWPVKLNWRKPDDADMARLVAKMTELAYEYWSKRPTLIFSFVVGGGRLIDNLIDSASITK